MFWAEGERTLLLMCVAGTNAANGVLGLTVIFMCRWMGLILAKMILILATGIWFDFHGPTDWGFDPWSHRLVKVPIFCQFSPKNHCNGKRWAFVGLTGFSIIFCCFPWEFWVLVFFCRLLVPMKANNSAKSELGESCLSRQVLMYSQSPRSETKEPSLAQKQQKYCTYCPALNGKFRELNSERHSCASVETNTKHPAVRTRVAQERSSLNESILVSSMLLLLLSLPQHSTQLKGRKIRVNLL